MDNKELENFYYRRLENILNYHLNLVNEDKKISKEVKEEQRKIVNDVKVKIRKKK